MAESMPKERSVDDSQISHDPEVLLEQQRRGREAAKAHNLKEAESARLEAKARAQAAGLVDSGGSLPARGRRFSPRPVSSIEQAGVVTPIITPPEVIDPAAIDATQERDETDLEASNRAEGKAFDEAGGFGPHPDDPEAVDDVAN